MSKLLFLSILLFHSGLLNVIINDDLSISDEEFKLISQFRDMVKDIEAPESQKDDQTLVRFLRASEHDLEHAKKRFSDSMEWRKNYGPDELFRRYTAQINGQMNRTAEFNFMRKYYALMLLGYDKSGLPVVWDRPGTSDYYGMIQEVGAENLLAWMVAVSEEGIVNYREVAKKRNKSFMSGIVVIDLKKMSFSHLYVAREWARLCDVVETNYPERIRTVYMVNAPWVFELIFNLAKPILSEATKKRMVFLSEHALEEFLKSIDIDNIPEYMGGKLAWPEYNHPGAIPKNSLIKEFGKSPNEPVGMWYGESLSILSAPVLKDLPPVPFGPSPPSALGRLDAETDLAREDSNSIPTEELSHLKSGNLKESEILEKVIAEKEVKSVIKGSSSQQALVPNLEQVVPPAVAPVAPAVAPAAKN
eukprot:c18142_g1_i1.p1 GENE.c18142_g1_i1~~c18142_g1_i1.p1  ORF type:complete len:435 (+),score=163.54 c18142_g1_i1:52-1305(+)